MQRIDFEKALPTTRPNAIGMRYKFKFGTIYGMLAGIAFACGSWGLDGLLLNQAHAAYPWLKLLLGAALCGTFGAIAGWITARFERWGVTLSTWTVATAVLAWATVMLPLQIAPIVSSWFQPQLRGLLHYSGTVDLLPNFWIAFAWILIFALIAGILETSLMETAIFSAYSFGKVVPFLVGVIILAMGGSVADGLINEPLQLAVTSLDSTIQFVVDNQGRPVDPSLSRANHAGSLGSISADVTAHRRLFISKYDSFLGFIDIVVKFDNLLADCVVVYGQPTFCKPVQSGP